jgi:hypothetical protein
MSRLPRILQELHALGWTALFVAIIAKITGFWS